MIEKGGKKLFWDWDNPMRTDFIARRPDLTLNMILLTDMACPNDNNKAVGK